MNQCNTAMFQLLRRIVMVWTCSLLGRVYADNEGLVSWYKMDAITESEGVRRIADASLNNRALTLGNGCWLTNGIAGSGLFFNGTAQAWTTFSSPALGTRTVSMVFWREQGNGALLEGQNTYPYLVMSLSTMNIHINTANDGGLVYINGSAITLPGLSIPRQQRMHLVWVYEQTPTETTNVYTSVCTFYRNGILVATSAPCTVTNTALASTVYLGNHSNLSRPIYGVLDEVRIYDKALSLEEIKQEAVRSIEADKAPLLLGQWSMDAIMVTNSLRIIRDHTGHGYDLQVGAGCQLTNGIDGAALSFNGTSSAWAVMTNGPSIASWSFAGWIRQDRASETPVVSGNYYPRIFHCNKANLMMHLGYNNNGLTYQGYNHSTSQQHFIRPDNGIWVHYAVVTRVAYNTQSNDFSSTPEFYVNGQKVVDGLEKITGILLWNLPYTLYFGNNEQNGTRPFMGDFDDFRFYDGALSAADVRAIYQGLPPLSAGCDFLTSSAQTMLQGAINDSPEHVLRLGFNAHVFWQLISAPVGGGNAVIETPSSAYTRVTLPAVGDYVFRLMATNAVYATHDDVKISRVAEQAGNQSPAVVLDATAAVVLPAPLTVRATISDADGQLGALRVKWTKVSGPGGVYFNPPYTNSTTVLFLEAGQYVLRCTADDGMATGYADMAVTVTGTNSTMSLTNGLVRYYPMNQMPYNCDVVGGSTAMTVQHYETGVAGYGLRAYTANGYADTMQTLPESGPSSSAPTNITHLSFSFWMYHDTSGSNASANAALIDVSFTLGIYYRCQDVSPGFILFQQGPGGSAMNYAFSCPERSPKNRWMHVYASFDRANGNELELYLDGVQQTKSSSTGKNTGRVVGNAIRFGSMITTPSGIQGPVTNAVSGGYYTRNFPGILDELRIYNRTLSDAEIRALAGFPVFVNRTPLPEIAMSVIVGNQGSLKPLEAVVFDDGLPLGTFYENRWRIVSGAVSGLRIVDETQLATTLALLKVGTYTVQLETTDGEHVAYSEIVTVVVNPRGTLILVN